MAIRRTMLLLAALLSSSACSHGRGGGDGGGAALHPPDAGGAMAAGGAGNGATQGGRGGAAGSASRDDTGASGPRALGSPDAGSDAGARGQALDANLADATNPDTAGLAAYYPGDVGLGGDAHVIWFEDFEEGSLAAIAARYDQTRDNGRFQLVSDTPNGVGSALSLRAGQGQDAVDLYKQLPDADEWYVRWYAKYQANVPWHHSGLWFGGYDPAMPYPSPMAGQRPNGDDRFSVSIEPVYDSAGATPRFDFYDYFMKMHSWMPDPVMNDGTAYYGNGFVHRNDFTVDPGHWVCLEVHLRLNSDPSSAAGAVLEVWKNDALLQRFDEQGPLGYWIRDKFCPVGADGSECTDYPAPATTVLDLQQRSTSALRLNAFWPQNYITDDAMGTLAFDQMVVASARVGCMRPK